MVVRHRRATATAADVDRHRQALLRRFDVDSNRPIRHPSPSCEDQRLTPS
jgi:hypothetical protein